MPFLSLSRCTVLAIAAASLAGCSTTTGKAQAQGPGAAQAATTSDSLAQTHWRLVRWQSPDGSDYPVALGQIYPPLSIGFTARNRDYRVWGFSGCNEFKGTYQLQGGKLIITLPSSRTMSCSSPQLGEAERAYLSALAHIVTFTLDSGGSPHQMTFNVRNGDVLTFTRGADIPVAK
jgi:heat shock protein HslJ